MKRFTIISLLVALASAIPATLGQDYERQDQTADDDAPLLKFELTPALLDNLLDKATAQLTKDYGLDDYQREQMREVLQQRVPAFIKEHRDQIQQLSAEWTRSVTAGEPPTAEEAADWASRALPLVDDLKVMLDGMTEDMRGFLTDRQEVLLDGYKAGIDVATNAVTDRLHVFKEGGFDPEIHWPGADKGRKKGDQDLVALQQEVEMVRQTTMTAHELGGARTPTAAPSAADPTPPPAGEAPKTAAKAPEKQKDQWELYVEQFIKRYQLGDDQKQKAHMFLAQQQQRRDQHLQRNAGTMARVKKLFDGAKTPREREIAEKAYQRFNQPIERMFEKLKQQLDTLPTRAQKQAAAAMDQKSKQNTLPKEQ